MSSRRRPSSSSWHHLIWIASLFYLGWLDRVHSFATTSTRHTTLPLQLQQTKHHQHLCCPFRRMKKSASSAWIVPSSSRRRRRAFFGLLPSSSSSSLCMSDMDDDDYEEVDDDDNVDDFDYDDDGGDDLLDEPQDDVEDEEEDDEDDLEYFDDDDEEEEDEEDVVIEEEDDDIVEDDDEGVIVEGEIDDEGDDMVEEEIVEKEEVAEQGDDEQVKNEYLLLEEEEEEYEEEEEFELEDDGSDPNYTKQKELMEDSIKNREQIKQDEDFDALDYIMDKMTEEEAAVFDRTDFVKQVEERTKDMLLTEDDVKDIDIDKGIESVSDLMDDDPYPVHKEGEENILEEATGVTDEDMEALDNAWKTLRETQKEQELDPWDKVTMKDLNTDWKKLPNQTIVEMEACLDEIDGSSYNCTRWLLYDLDFNVTNLILAAVKHNRKAPILFMHWYPQLLTYERYEDVREGGFDWSWDDVQAADISELERYYAGFGYDEIPKKAPSETGIISLESLDEEEILMAAFDSWHKDVYNPEWDLVDFDDDNLRDEDNVFSEFYEHPQHPDLPTFEDAEEDFEEFEKQMGNDTAEVEYRDLIYQNHNYTVQHDDEFNKVFRGHLVVACTGDEADLDIAEKITQRMSEEFGKQVFVETRLMAHAREEDNVFEVWLESYEIDLLHSKKRATMGTKGWKGPRECDDAQVEYLVDRVRFLISDDSRYSYRMFDDSISY